MSSIPNMPIWVQFFETFRELPELWKIKSDIYKDRQKKKIAWEKLLALYVEIEPNANVDSLKKRLTNIRTCYRRELKKVQQGEKSGAGAEDEYVPNLWYFPALDFLRDQEVQVAPSSTIDLEDDEECEEPELKESNESIKPNSQKRKKVGQRDLLMSERNCLLKEAVQKMHFEKDDAAVFAESWAVSFRKLSPTQQLFAKKAIEDVLILGQLKLLNLNSVNNPLSSNSPGPSTPLQSNDSRSSTPIIVPMSSPSPQCESLASPQYENLVVQIQPPAMNNYPSFQELLSDTTFH